MKLYNLTAEKWHEEWQNSRLSITLYNTNSKVKPHLLLGLYNNCTLITLFRAQLLLLLHDRCIASLSQVHSKV